MAGFWTWCIGHWSSGWIVWLGFLGLGSAGFGAQGFAQVVGFKARESIAFSLMARYARHSRSDFLRLLFGEAGDGDSFHSLTPVFLDSG